MIFFKKGQIKKSDLAENKISKLEDKCEGIINNKGEILK